jgi:hypothetical protein
MSSGYLVSTSIPNLINGVSQQPYTIRLPTQAEEVVNCYPSVVEFLKRRQATKHLTKLVTGEVTKGFTHLINRDENEQYILLITDGDLKVFDLNGVQKTVSFPDGKNYLNTTDPNTKISTLTINDYTFILNKTKTVQMSPDLTHNRGPEALIFIKQASYGTTYKIEVDGVSWSVTTPTQTTELVQSTAIAANLASQMQTAIGSDFNISLSHSTIWIQRKDGWDFQVRAEDSRSNTHMVCIKGKVQKFSDLPIVAPKDFVVEVEGDASSSFDNYYVKFVPNNPNATFDNGVWLETVKQGIKHQFDATTMPHALIRQADGTFVFKKLDWTPRICGDEDSAPEPSFVGRQIDNIFFYKNRLAFLSRENVIMSSVGEFFTFWPKTVTTMVDSDPVDVAASHTKVSALEHATPFSGGLILFSETTQFSLQHDDVLSNSTVAVKPITEFSASMLAAPVSAGRTVFFATDRGKYGGVREYYAMPDTDTNDAADISAHVPQYIGGKIFKLVSSPNEDVLFVLCENTPNEVFVYKYFWNNNDKIQSAWSKWVFAGKVVGMTAMNTVVHLLIQYPDGLYLERLNIESGYVDQDGILEFKMDRKIDETEVLGISYNDALNTSTITLPYPLYPGMEPVIISRGGGPDPAGVLFEILAEDRTGGKNTITILNQDMRGRKFYIGIKYLSRYVFSRPTLRESKQGGQVAILEGRLQLRSMRVNFHETGYFEAVVTPRGRAASVYPFSGRVLGTVSAVLGEINLHTGSMNIPILSKNDQVDIEIRSDSPLPFNLVSAEWEGFYNSRSSHL